MIKAEFSASFLQSSVSHDPSEIILICWFAAQETFIIIINVESCSALYFWKPWSYLMLNIYIKKFLQKQTPRSKPWHHRPLTCVWSASLFSFSFHSWSLWPSTSGCRGRYPMRGTSLCPTPGSSTPDVFILRGSMMVLLARNKPKHRSLERNRQLL